MGLSGQRPWHTTHRLTHEARQLSSIQRSARATRGVVEGVVSKGTPMDELTKTIASRGDLAHLALFLWASGASALLAWTLRELARANQRFEDFVKETAALNRLFSSPPSDRSRERSFGQR